MDPFIWVGIAAAVLLGASFVVTQYIAAKKKADGTTPTAKAAAGETSLEWFDELAAKIEAFFAKFGIKEDIAKINSNVKQVAVYAALVFGTDLILDEVDPTKREAIAGYIEEIKDSLGHPAIK